MKSYFPDAGLRDQLGDGISDRALGCEGPGTEWALSWVDVHTFREEKNRSPCHCRLPILCLCLLLTLALLRSPSPAGPLEVSLWSRVCHYPVRGFLWLTTRSRSSAHIAEWLEE